MLEKFVKKYNLGVIAARTITLEQVHGVLDDKVANIGHIITNDVADGGWNVIEFAISKNIPVTIHPVAHISGGILPSNAHIVASSDFTYILDNGDSGNAILAQRECEKQNKKYKVIKL